MTVHRAILTSLCLAVVTTACGAPTEPDSPAGPLVPTGRYELVRMQGDTVPGWVRSLCRTANECESSQVHGGTLEFPGGNGCIWTLQTPAGTSREDGLDCMLIVDSRSVRVRIGTVTRLLVVAGGGLHLTYTPDCGSNWLCLPRDWWVYRKVG